jgi:hypothetical protein
MNKYSYNKIDNKKIKDLIHKLGLKYKLSDDVIKEIVESPYEFGSIIIKKLELDELENIEQLDDIKTNFMFTGFSKLYINPAALKNRINKRLNKINLNK